MKVVANTAAGSGCTMRLVRRPVELKRRHLPLSGEFGMQSAINIMKGTLGLRLLKGRTPQLVFTPDAKSSSELPDWFKERFTGCLLEESRGKSGQVSPLILQLPLVESDNLPRASDPSGSPQS